MEKMFNEIINKLNNLENKIDELTSKVDSNHKEVMTKLDEFEPKNATRHSEINLKIDTISKDIKFIKHKIHETEEDVFDIKDHLKIIK